MKRPNRRADLCCIDLAVIRVQQRRVPQPPADHASRTKSPTCRNKVRLLCVKFKAQYQAFVRFAVASSAALSAIALNQTCLLEPFTRTGSLARILASSRRSTGRANPEPMLYQEGSRSPGIFQAVFSVLRRLYQGFFCPDTALRMPPRSAFGGAGRVSPDATIRPATSSLWSWPTSTTRRPPGASNRAASGAIIR